MEAALGIVAGILTMCGIVPQIVKAYKSKQVDDVSRGMLMIIMSGVGLWSVYGILKDDIPIITNALAFLLNGYMLLLTYKLKK